MEFLHMCVVPLNSHVTARVILLSFGHTPETYDSCFVLGKIIQNIRFIWRHVYRVFTYIFFLPIEKDICDGRNI